VERTNLHTFHILRDITLSLKQLFNLFKFSVLCFIIICYYDVKNLTSNIFLLVLLLSVFFTLLLAKNNCKNNFSGQTKDRSISERPHLTPIKENDSRSPRPRSIDEPTMDEFHEDERCITEVNEGDGSVLLTMEGSNMGEGSPNSGAPSSESWDHINRSLGVSKNLCFLTFGKNPIACKGFDKRQ